MTKVSVIIPSLNSTTLPRTLTGVASQSRPPAEVIVIGRDEAGILCNFPHVQFIDTGAPVCAAAARNLGVSRAGGEFFVFTDADCIPNPDWLRLLHQRLEAGERVVGGSVELKGSNYWAQSDNVSMFHDFVPESRPGPRPFLPSLNLGLHRSVVEHVGGMDESFPGAAAEDTDWTIRMRRAGYQLYFEPAAKVQHIPARTDWPDVARHWRNLGRNAIRVRLRYADDFDTPAFVRRPTWLRLLSPLIAAKATLDIYAQPYLRSYWTTIPVVYATKILYCWSAARAVASGEALR
ncbi:MAG: glycosyltransferase [Chloroflexota bacterium]